MLQFIEPQDATMTTFTGRTEKHGDEWIPAVTFGFKITGSNVLLDLISPTLRPTLYKAVDGQEDLPGVDPTTPLLRSKEIDVLPLGIVYEGWTATVEHGISNESAIVLGDSKVEVVSVQVYEGGSVDIHGKVSSSDVDAREAGLLWSKQKSAISLILKAPEPKADPIDGSVSAFEADHPGQGSLLDDDAPAMDATDAFIRSGTDEGLGADDDLSMPPGTHNEAERQEHREAAVEASRERRRKGAESMLSAHAGGQA